MGLKLSKLASDRIQQAVELDRKRHPEKYAPVPGRLQLFVHGDPPTVTHQAKRIQMRGKRLRLCDSPALLAARAHYMHAIPERSGPPIAGPLLARLAFCWADASMGAGAEPRWMELAPDVDNATKAVLDAVAARRWIQNDSNVARLVAVKAFVPPHRAGVWIQVETLLVPPLIGWEIKWLAAPTPFEPFPIGGPAGVT